MPEGVVQAFLVRRILDHAKEVFEGAAGVRPDAHFTSLAGLPGAAGVTLQEFKHWAALVRVCNLSAESLL